ncbi:glycosyltransferase family 1 protein [Qipengyuania flava]|uniref:Glycosyltransferase family 1 protein n=1 Tax=Qipengyuania flava TaxID=192812 RepID=A0A5P6ND96_9SPHN|nr:glycosyltransferase family 1 protein [Qipengyuania flava]
MIYNYYPQYRRPIFESLKQLHESVCFIYGKNSWQNVANVVEEEDHVRRNIFIAGLTFQTFGLSTLARICRNDTIVIGDIRFVNAWIYALIGRICGRQIYFWTHGVLEPEQGFKWFLRRHFYMLSDALMLYSRYERVLLEEMGYPKPLIVIGNSNFSDGDASKILQRERGESALPGNDVCYVGRVSQEKGIEEFARFAEAHPEKRVVLVGPVTAACDRYRHRYSNLIFLEPEYELERLRDITSGCGTLVMFTAAGLSLFTAILLNKRALVKRTFPQKPEYHLLRKYGLVDMFDDYDEMEGLLEYPTLSDAEFEAARTRFFVENSGQMVAKRIMAALG